MEHDRTMDAQGWNRDLGPAVRPDAVAVRGSTEHDADRLVTVAHARDMALALIETMPFGDTGVGRLEHCLSLAWLQQDLTSRWTMTAADERYGQSAKVAGAAARLPAVPAAARRL